MKKNKTLLLLLIVGFLMLPLFVYADGDEPLPTDGVHYFFTYPDGSESVSGEYEDVEEPKERLIISKKTNANGEVVIEGLSEEGTLHILETAPDGSVEELYLDLASDNKNIDFVANINSNTPAPENPKTGQSLLILVGVMAIVLVAVKIIKPESKKSTLMILPIMVVGFMALQVGAASNRVVITVRDKAGNKVEGAKIDIYSKPIAVEAYPAILITANGGYLFDGSSEIYMRIPDTCTTGCNFNSFLKKLSQDDYSYVWKNITRAYRRDYTPSGIEFPEEFVDGSTVKINWQQSTGVKLLTVDGNGGAYNLHGRHITSITGYHYSAYDLAYGFQKNNMYSIGADDDASCAQYNQYGMPKNNSAWNENATIVYACWHAKPDGLYVNGKLFLGTDQTCYNQAKAILRPNSIDFRFDEHEFEFTKFSDNTVKFSRLMKEEANVEATPKGMANPLVDQLRTVSARRPDDNYSFIDVTSLEIIKNGQVVVSLTSDDITKEDNEFIVNNAEKREALYNYLNTFYNMCFEDI